MVASLVGKTEPRLWTKPLRELTSDTSRGFEVIDFAHDFLHVDLYPWQKWLLIHGLELLESGEYRFRRVIVLVARQSGKSMLAAVLAAWWLFIEAGRNPERVAPVDFKVLGMAQNLDIARGPWEAVKRWCDPDPDEAEAEALAIPALQRATAKVLDSNGKERILTESLAHYEVRAGRAGRGKPAARVLMDELREQETWQAWNATSQTTKSFWNGQLWGLSNAGSVKSVVLIKQREYALQLAGEQDEALALPGADVGRWAEGHDTSVGIFEWSAPDECALTDVDGILQANPSIGYGGISVASCLSDSRSMVEADYRTEVLCQWVTSKVEPYIAPAVWRDCLVDPADVEIPAGALTVWGVDTSQNRSRSFVSAVTRLADGRIFGQVVAGRTGMMWPVPFLAERAQGSGFAGVALQSKGSPSMEFVPALEAAGIRVIGVDGSHVGSATGVLRDRVRDGQFVTVDQPDVQFAVAGGVTRKYAENDAWSRISSLPVDIAPLCSLTWAVWALESLALEPPPARSAYESGGLMIL